jgi:hypothetical protein
MDATPGGSRRLHRAETVKMRQRERQTGGRMMAGDQEVVGDFLRVGEMGDAERDDPPVPIFDEM